MRPDAPVRGLLSATTADDPVAAQREPTLPFRADIEGLRGVAIVVVVLFHAGLDRFAGGYVGVDVFFVLSGFLITGILVREIRGRGRIGFWGFYARRFRRLMPALLAMVLGTLVLGAVIGSAVDLEDWVRTARTVPVFASNLFFAHRATDYLADDGNGNLYLHTWTLAVEEQFYLVWPALLAVAAKLGGRRIRGLAVGVGLAIVASGALSLYQTDHAPAAAFFGPFSRFWEFGIGALIVLLPARLAPGRTLGIASAAVGLLAILYASVRFSASTPFPGTAALVPVLGTALVVYSGTGPRPAFRNLALENPPMRWLGLRSYSWYLWHWPAIVLVVVLYPEGGDKAKLAAAVASLVAADLSYRFVESPTRHAPWLVAQPRRTVLVGIATIVVGSILLAGMGVVTGRRLAHGEARRYHEAASDIPAAFDDGCVARFSTTDPPTADECTYGDLDADRTIAVLGDSHAAHWVPALDRLGKQHGYRVQMYAKSSCPASDVVVTSSALHRRYRECEEFRTRSIEAIAAARPDQVLLTSFATYVESGTQDLDAEQWGQGLQRTIDALEPSGAEVTVLHDVPTSPQSVPGCLEQRTAPLRLRSGDCTFARSTPAREEVIAAEEAAARATGARSVDPTDTVCPEVRCRPVEDGIVTYFDASHLSATYARSLAPWLAEALGLTGRP